MIPRLRSRLSASALAPQRAARGMGLGAVLFALALVVLACGGDPTIAVQTGNTPSASASSSTSDSGGGTPTVTTVPPTATATHSPTGPTPTPVPFKVSGASVSASPAAFNGLCTSTMTTTFTATINVPAHTPGGTVTYHWTRSDGATGPAKTLHFNAGDTFHTASDTWSFGAANGNGSTYWEAVVVTAPNGVTSSHGNATLTCQHHVGSIATSVRPTSYNCTLSSQTFTFTAVINVSPSPASTITYKWLRSDGASGSNVVVSVPAGASSVTVTTTWTLGSAAPNGTYGEKVSVSSPNSVTSSQANFTKSC